MNRKRMDLKTFTRIAIMVFIIGTILPVVLVTIGESGFKEWEAYWIIIMISCILLGMPLIFIAKAISLQNCSASVEAIIVDVEGDGVGSASERIYYPVVEYTVDGEKHRNMVLSGGGKKRWKVGNSLKVYYDPAAPDKVSDQYRGGESNSLTVFGRYAICFFCFGAYMVFLCIVAHLSF